MSTLVTGATGWIGRRLLPHLENVTATSRCPTAAKARLGDQVSEVLAWDPCSGPLSLQGRGPFGTVVNLMGESIAEGRWTANKKKRIRDSRLLGTRNLVESLLSSGSLPNTLISSSAIGIYGEQGDRILDESQPAADDFIGHVCADWEAACQPLVDRGVRVVWMRTGIVLGPNGGALGKMLPPFRWGCGGTLGAGHQWMSWIHWQDLIALILFAINNEQVSGAINAVSPLPVTNREFTIVIGQKLNRPTLFRVPNWVLRLVLGEFASVLTASQHVLPVHAQRSGFHFTFPDLSSALDDCLALSPN